MGGAFTAGTSQRVRIKGHWQSVLRFFFIAVGFMMGWVLVSSELAYYSKWFGPQILLQLNFAFYLPSIPVLVVSGQVEKCLDRRVGPISSMMIRLNIGLAGSAAICAAFPFITKTHSGLLTIVAVLGTLSAIAFSTSYQLVQWFRHADIIGLGIGAVGTGPLVLLIQLGLVQLQTWPQRWQWIAQFEITAVIVLLGLLSSLSLFGQYWDILTGATPYEDIQKPLLAEEDEAQGAEAGTLDVTGDGSTGGGGGGKAYRRVSTGGGVVAIATQPRSASNWYGRVEVMDEQERAAEHVLAQTVASPGNIILAPDPFHGGMPVVFRDPAMAMLSPRANDSRAPTLESRRRSDTLEDAIGIHGDWHASGRAASGDRTANGGLATGVSPFRRQSAPVPALPGDSSRQASGAAPAPGSASQGAGGVASGAGRAQLPGVGSVDEEADHPGSMHAPQQQGGVERSAEEATAPKLSLAEETLQTVSLTWPVMTSFFLSVTLMYLIFPFFTYIPSNGMLGDVLPRVLFFTRIGADLVGRFAPRVKSLLTHSPNTLFALAISQATLAVLLIVYIKAPEEFLNDIFPVSAVVFLWTAAGYVNTCANMLAPAMVPDHLCPRASALMALMFQIAHFAGLVLAAVLVYVMFGDLAG